MKKLVEFFETFVFVYREGKAFRDAMDYPWNHPAFSTSDSLYVMKLRYMDEKEWSLFLEDYYLALVEMAYSK